VRGEAYRHQRVVQLSPIHGTLYRVWANYQQDGPSFFKELVVSLALVDEWWSRSDDGNPSEDDNPERVIRSVECLGDYFDVDSDEHGQLIGFYWKEDLADPEVLYQIETEAVRKRAAETARRIRPEVRITETRLDGR
jgi:hypothetical protein